jgi:hypothetical protein
VIDYLALIRSDVRRQKQQEEHNDVLKSAKMMATSFRDGAGIPVVSPWSVSQTAWKEAMRNRAYTLGCLSETSEAEKSSDGILAILREEDEHREARLQWLKVRDGDLPPIQEVELDFRTSYIGDRRGLATYSTNGSAAGTSSRDELSAFLGES